MVTRGRHAHPPPPPSKLPIEVANEVREVLEKQDCLALTARRFLLSPEWTDIHNRFGPSSLRALHKTLNVEDKVAALVRKQRLLCYPRGTALAGTSIKHMLGIC